MFYHKSIKESRRRRTDRNFDKVGFMDRPEDAPKSSSNYIKQTTSSSARNQRLNLELHGGAESGRTSAVRICCYSHCSLNGHDSQPLPPLRSFLKARRSTVQTQKAMKVRGISPFRKEETDTGHAKTHQKIIKDDNESSDYDRARKNRLSEEEEEGLDKFVNSLEYDEFDNEIDDEGRGHDEGSLVKGEPKFSTDFSESLDSDVGLTSIVFESENSLTADEIVEYSSEITEEDDDNLINKFNIGEIPEILDEDRFGEIRTSPNLIEGNSEAKSNTKRIRRTEKKTKEIREFNPRPPRFLPLKPDDGAEKVDLRHQMTDGRRNSEEWMIDYALQQTVTRLAPARNKKVELLVEAFETIMPTGYNHSNTLQPCS